MLTSLRSHQHVPHTTSQHSVSVYGCQWDSAHQKPLQPQSRAAGSGAHQGCIAQRTAVQPRSRSALLAHRAQDAPVTAGRAAVPAQPSEQAANRNGAAHVPQRSNGSHAEPRPPHAASGTATHADRGDNGIVQHENGSTFQQVEQYGADQTRRRQSWYRWALLFAALSFRGLGRLPSQTHRTQGLRLG